MIVGERIYLRPFATVDVPIRTQWMNDPEVNTHLDLPRTITESSTADWLSNLNTDPTRLDFIICINETDLPIGYIGFRDIDQKNKKAESYTAICNKAYLRQGLAKESKILAYRYLFVHYEMHKIYAYVNTDNQANIKSFTGFGSKQEALLRDDVFFKGRYCDRVMFGMLKEEFMNKYGAMP